MYIDVCFTPQDYLRRDFAAGHTAVVIDALRATSCIVTAFANGCERFVPVATVEEAMERKSHSPEGLLGGERHALKIPGFDLGNSPFEYTAAAVGGKTVIMSTTNGTVALLAAQKAGRVYAGAFLNAAAVCERLRAAGWDAVIICAGSAGEFSLEDAACAGLMAGRLAGVAKLGDLALAARAMYAGLACDLVKRVGESSHAANLISLGFADDVGYCLQQDMYSVVPQFIKGEVVNPAE